MAPPSRANMSFTRLMDTSTVLDTTHEPIGPASDVVRGFGVVSTGPAPSTA